LPTAATRRRRNCRSALARFLLKARCACRCGSRLHPSREFAMSVFGALNTAISGLSAQAAAFSSISNNVANSQTVGYKEAVTSFRDYLDPEATWQSQSGAVTAGTEYMDDVQGTIVSSTDSTALAVSGQGFFSVSMADGATASGPTFSPERYYTRAGDFSLNAEGYLVNGVGDYLNGWSVAANGAVNQNALAPIQISETVYDPVATANITLSANLPPGGNPDPAKNTIQDPITSTVNVYDSQGTEQALTLSFTSANTPTTPDSNSWTLNVTDASGNNVGTATVDFDANGDLLSVTQNGATQNTAGNAATVTLATTFPTTTGTQNISLNVGDIGTSDGLTQYSGSSYSLRSISQDGCAPGSFSSVSMTTTGNVVVNYNNGQSRTIAQVPVITFSDPNGLQQQGYSTMAATNQSGNAIADAAGTNGAGTLQTSSVEESNVDLATEMTNLIVAQQAYSANAKLVTAADALLTTTINMKQQ
jgi:flagellar hook protein FlgE